MIGTYGTARAAGAMRAAALSAALAFAASTASAQDLQSILAAEAAVEAAWAQTPLAFRKTLFVTEATGFGIYSERADANFAAGEPILVYAEPVGYGYEENADGTHDIGFEVDLLVKTADGQVVGGQDGFARLVLTSHGRNREFMLSLRLDLDEAPAGDYVVEYTAHDIASDKVGVISLPFAIVE